MKVSVTKRIENSGAFSKFTCSLILFTSGCSLWSLILFSVLKYLDHRYPIGLAFIP